MSAQVSKARQRQQIITTAICLALLAIGSMIGAHYGQNRPTKAIGEAMQTSSQVKDTEWHVGTTVYTVPAIEPWVISINQDSYWLARRRETDRTHILQLSVVEADQTVTSDTKATMAGIDGVRLDSQHTYFDGDEQKMELKLTVQVPVDDKYLQAQYLIQGSLEAVTDKVVSDAKAEFTTFVSGITKQ